MYAESVRVTEMLVWGWMRCGCGECMHEGGTRGSGIYVIEMSVVCRMRGVGEVCEMCMCLARGGMGGEAGEWMIGLGLGCTNPVRTGGVLDVCRCLSCGGVGGVGGEWVRGLDQGLEGWGGVMSV